MLKRPLEGLVQIPKVQIYLKEVLIVLHPLIEPFAVQPSPEGDRGRAHESGQSAHEGVAIN